MDPADRLSEWCGTERRSRPCGSDHRALTDILQQMRDESRARGDVVAAVNECLEKLSKAFAHHVETEEGTLTAAIRAAFPDGDLASHRESHAILIQQQKLRLAAQERRARLANAVIEKSLTFILGLFLLYALGYVVDSVAHQFGYNTQFSALILKKGLEP